MRPWIVALLTGCTIDVTVARVPFVEAGVDATTRCPQKADTATMIDLGDFCIDAFETTRAQYAKFLASGPKNIPGGACAGNTKFVAQALDTTCTPDQLDLSTLPNHPVVCVDWCDAAAYCAWAGKRLCGRVGGGSQPLDDFDGLNSVDRNEWYAACAGGDPTPRRYAYRGEYDPGRCLDKTVNSAQSVGSKSECHGPPGTPQAAVYDLSGSVYEWVDSCQAGVAVDPLMQACLTRGGFFGNDEAVAPYLACAVTPANQNNLPRNRGDHHVGIRCCAR